MVSKPWQDAILSPPGAHRPSPNFDSMTYIRVRLALMISKWQEAPQPISSPPDAYKPSPSHFDSITYILALER